MKKILIVMLLAGCTSQPLTERQTNEHPFCDGSPHSNYQWVCEERGTKMHCACTPVHLLPREVRDEFEREWR